jgi:hypothetical protein
VELKEFVKTAIEEILNWLNEANIKNTTRFIVPAKDNNFLI